MTKQRLLWGAVIALTFAAGCGGDDPTAVTADPPAGLAPATLVKLQVAKSGTGTGRVTSSPAGIDCPTTCSGWMPVGTVITLTAAPSAGSVFGGWSGGGCSGTGSCTITMSANTRVVAAFDADAPPLTITTTELPNGNRGAEYTAFISSSGGGGGQDQFSLVEGSLPDGLTMAQFFGVQSTVISGTPTTEGTFIFTVEVEDDSGSATRTLSITIDPPTPLVITLPGATSKSGTVGTFYFQNLFADGGAQPYTWSITQGELPPGLALIHASNGNRIEGTPTTAGTFTFTVTVTDDFGATASQQTTITIS
jgi:hypothetical protein